MISYDYGLVVAVSIAPVSMLFGVSSANYPRGGLPGCVCLYSDNRVGMDSAPVFRAAARGAHGRAKRIVTPARIRVR